MRGCHTPETCNDDQERMSLPTSFFRLLSLVLAASLTLVVGAQAREKAPHLTILVSMDGFRADYLDRGLTPNLKALADDGARGASCCRCSTMSTSIRCWPRSPA